MTKEKQFKLFYYTLGLFLLLVLWKGGALIYKKDIILPQPELVIRELVHLTQSDSFITIVYGTIQRGIYAFVIAMVLGVLIGIFSFLLPAFSIIIHPFMTLIRATPVVALILLALIWFPSTFVPVFSAILMSFPVITTSIYTGLSSVDMQYVEMMKAYRFLPLDRIRYLYIPTLKPFFFTAMHNTLSLTWKVVIAGEILSQPVFAIGTEMNNARIMLETPKVFAWVLCGIFLCAASDLFFYLVFRKAPWNLQSKT